LSASDLAALVDRAVAQSQLWAGLLKIDLLDFAAVLPPVTATAAPTVHTGSRLRILIVEDDPIARTLLLTWLKVDGGHRLYTASNGEEAMDLALRYSPQIIITDWRMPVMNGLELCKNLRLSDWGRSIYVLMLTAADEEEDLVTAFEAGVDDYLTKPLKRPALGARLKAAWRYVQLRETWMRDNERLARVAADLELSNRRHQLASLTDTLTGLPNRRAGQSSLTQAISAAQRYGKQLCVISIDIDHFKHINDRYGHGGGDEVLQLIGNTIQHVARVEDTVCRWGGEEFLIVAPNISLEEGIAAAHRFRRFVESLAISVDVHSISVTISLGVACLDVDSKTRDRLLIEADQALYEAKLAGRNRVAVMDNFGNAIVC
jgi:diguanylate cyclase (GGDEF)-like protein